MSNFLFLAAKGLFYCGMFSINAFAVKNVSYKCLDQINLALGKGSISSTIPVECQYFKVSDLDEQVKVKIFAKMGKTKDSFNSDSKLSSVLGALLNADSTEVAVHENVKLAPKGQETNIDQVPNAISSDEEDLANIPKASPKDVEYCVKPFEYLKIHLDAFPLIKKHADQTQVCNFLALKLEGEFTDFYANKYGKAPHFVENSICEKVLVRDTDLKFKKLYETLDNGFPQASHHKRPLKSSENLHEVLLHMYSKSRDGSSLCNWKGAVDKTIPPESAKSVDDFVKSHQDRILKFENDTN